MFVLIKSWAYMVINVFYFLFNKRWTDKKIKEYLNRKYKKDDIIVIAVHGIFEYYWQSLVKYMKYFDKRGKVVIPLGYDYYEPHGDSVKKLSKEIEEIKKKTGAQIVLLGNSSGSNILVRYMYQTKGKLIKEFIPLGIANVLTPRGVTFWWTKWIEKTPKKELNFYIHKSNQIKVPKTNINIYAKRDVFILKGDRQMKPLKNIGFNTGHFGMLYDLEVIKFVYGYIF